MSGEMTGAIFGGIVLIAALPYVVAGAAAVGATVGAVKLTGAVIRHAANRSSRKAYETNYSSRQLSAMYSKMNHATDNRRKAEERIQRDRARAIEKETARISELTGQMEQLARKAEAREDSAERAAARREVEQLKHQINAHQQALSDLMTRDLSRDLAAIEKQAHEEAAMAIEEMQRLNQKQAELMDWKSNDERIRMQLALHVKQSVQDARQSLAMLEAMEGLSSADLRTASALRAQLNNASAQLEQGMLEAAMAASQDVITRCALTSLACAERYEEREGAAELLIQELEMLREEMQHRREIRFQLDDRPEETCEDLNDFSQGEYERIQQQIAEMLERLENRSSSALSVGEILIMHQQLRDVIRPNAKLVMETAQNAMMSYYEKLAEMDIVADFMLDQGYEVDWGDTVGGDPTQKMVMHFVDETSGNTVAVTLDEDMSEEALRKMNMDLMMFYGDGNEVSEEQKQALRTALKQALGEHGLEGSLHCSGQVNKPSEKEEYNDPEAIRSAQVRKQFGRG